MTVPGFCQSSCLFPRSQASSWAFQEESLSRCSNRGNAVPAYPPPLAVPTFHSRKMGLEEMKIQSRSKPAELIHLFCANTPSLACLHCLCHQPDKQPQAGDTKNATQMFPDSKCNFQILSKDILRKIIKNF